MTPRLVVELIPTEPPYSAFLIHTSKYPLQSGFAASSRNFAASLLANSSSGTAGPAFFLQSEYLQNAKTEFGAHLQQWRPQSGLGIWPDRPPPRLWETTDMFRMARGERIPLMYRVLRLAGDQRTATDAFNRMMGTGTVMTISHAGSIESLLKQYKETFLPNITQPNLRIFPFYVPLLDIQSVRNRKAVELSKWLGPARLYLRESPQDGGVLTVTNLDIEPLLAHSGAKKEHAGSWEFK